MTDSDKDLAHSALRSGNYKEARRILRILVHESPDDWTLWWQLAQATDEIEQKITCVKQVLKLNPENAEAATLLRQIERKIARPTPVGGNKRPSPEIQQSSSHGQGGGPIHQPPARGIREVNRSLLPVATFGIIALILIMSLIAVFIIFRGLLSSPRPTAAPNLALSISIESCIVDGGESARVVFRNESGVPILMSQGEIGAEEELFQVNGQSEAPIEVDPDHPTRYSASAVGTNINPGGAVIAVPSGSSCVVVIR